MDTSFADTAEALHSVQFTHYVPVLQQLFKVLLTAHDDPLYARCFICAISIFSNNNDNSNKNKTTIIIKEEGEEGKKFDLLNIYKHQTFSEGFLHVTFHPQKTCEMYIFIIPGFY